MADGSYHDVLEAEGPSVETFYRGEPHWSDPPNANRSMIAVVEDRLAIALPDLLKILYLRQNGGGTDFVFSAKYPGASLDAGKEFERDWLCSIPDDGLRPVDDLTTMTDLQATFDHDPDASWEKSLPGAARLVRIAQQGWDEYLCLDYGDGSLEPRVVFFRDGIWEPGVQMAFEATWPSFEAFFASLRRPILTEENGVLYRGIKQAGPNDSGVRHA